MGVVGGFVESLGADAGCKGKDEGAGFERLRVGYSRISTGLSVIQGALRLKRLSFCISTGLSKVLRP